jgi:hypothetical protein
LDYDSITGNVDCVYNPQLCFDPPANTTCANVSYHFSFENGGIENLTYCYDFLSPYYQQVCYFRAYEGGILDDVLDEIGECGISFNGITCNSCLETEDGDNSTCVEFDCSNTEGMHMGDTCQGDEVMLILENLNISSYPPLGSSPPVETADVDELTLSLVESGDLTQGEIALIEPSVVEIMIADSPYGFFSGAVDVDPTFASEDIPANAVGGTFQLESTFSPTQGGIPGDLTCWVYDSTNGLVDSGPVSPDGSFSVNLDDVPSGKNLYLITFSSPTTAASAPARRQRSLSTSIATAMPLWVERATIASTGSPSAGPSITPSVSASITPSVSASQVPTPLESDGPTSKPISGTAQKADTNSTDPPGSSARTLVSSKEVLSLLGLSAALFMYFAC